MRKQTVGALALLLSANAWACSCANLSPPETMGKASSVFRARVVSTSSVVDTTRPADHPLRETVRATFQVLETLKGDPSKIPFVASGAPTGGSCGLVIATGIEYVFIVWDSNAVNKCSSWSPELWGEPGFKRLEEFRAVKGGK